MEIVPTNFFIHNDIIRINKRSIFKTKNWCKLQLQTHDAMKLLRRTEKLTNKTKNWENVPSTEIVEVN